MIFKKTLLVFCGLALVFLSVAPHMTSAASGRGLFKDMYCAVLSVVNIQCETEVEGLKIKDRASMEGGMFDSQQAAVSDAVSRMFSR
jgi:hypothetical protein